MNADQAENWYTSSTDSHEKMCQSSPPSVPISKSYDQNKFSIVFINKNHWKNRDFRKIISRPYQRIFGFFLHEPREYAVILLPNSKFRKISTKIDLKNWPKVPKNAKKCEKCARNKSKKKNCKNALNPRRLAGFWGVSFWPLPYEKRRNFRILQNSAISTTKHEILSVKSPRKKSGV